MPSWFCGQNSQPKPDCHQRRIVRHEARGKRRLGFDRGAGALLARASPNRLTVASSYATDRSPGLALFLPRGSDRGMGGLRTMISRTRDRVARRRGELNRDRVRRRLSLAIDARRRLDARRPSRAWVNANGVGGSDPRYAYLTRSRDEVGG